MIDAACKLVEGVFPFANFFAKIQDKLRTDLSSFLTQHFRIIGIQCIFCYFNFVDFRWKNGRSCKNIRRKIRQYMLKQRRVS